MLSGDYLIDTIGKETHASYVADSNRYRAISNVRRNSERLSKPGILETLGARLIALGRTLCERRGTLAVEIAFRPGAGAGRSGRHGRHVA